MVGLGVVEEGWTVGGGSGGNRHVRGRLGAGSGIGVGGGGSGRGRRRWCWRGLVMVAASVVRLVRRAGDWCGVGVSASLFSSGWDDPEARWPRGVGAAARRPCGAEGPPQGRSLRKREWDNWWWLLELGGRGREKACGWGAMGGED